MTHPASASGVQGVAFPIMDGRRSTTATGRAVFADAARAIDERLASEIEAEDDWRKEYVRHARRLLEARLRMPHQTTPVAAAGLASLHRRFEFVRDGGTAPLTEAVDATESPGLPSIDIKGQGARPDTELSVPYRGQRLRGDALHRQLDRWVSDGTVEPSFAEAVRVVMANPDWLDLSDQHVAVLGAGAEMGPLFSLCRWGAHVLPIDLPRAALWRRIISAVREGHGRASIPLIAPVPAGADDEAIASVAGADLVTDLPEVAAWLDDAEGPLTLGNYLYADGEIHVRVAMSADALASRLTERRDDVSLAVLATPTDVFAAPEDAVDMAQLRFAEAGTPRAVESAVRGLTGGRLFAPNYPDVITTEQGRRFGVADCLVPQQGPNYALAKRLQRWRASLAREAGTRVSVNIAPPTRTRSVLRNRALAAAYGGARRFGVEVFDPSTSNTLMAALLVHDLRAPGAVADPRTPLDHPLDLFIQGANHGGLWRNPFAPRSVLGIAVVLGMVQRGA